MNNVIRGAVAELGPRYKDRADNEILSDIRSGNRAGDALFYLLFGRYAEMLLCIFNQQAALHMESDDFMLELYIRLFAGRCAALSLFDGSKALFKTYLSKIAHNLLYDMREKEVPMLDVETVQCAVSGVDASEMFALVDAINSYPNQDSRYVLLKTVEGYKSNEIAQMLTGKKHEEGTLEEDKQLKSSYIDTLRSRALRDIRHRIAGSVDGEIYEGMPVLSVSEVGMDFSVMSKKSKRREPAPESVVMPLEDMSNLFVRNICKLYNRMMNI